MTQADAIRHHVLETYITPARNRRMETVEVRAVDVHRDLGLANAMPAVCSAIGSHKFLSLANVALASRTGPANGANVYFTYSLADGHSSDAIRPASPRIVHHTPHRIQSEVINLRDALVLVSCVKSKLPYAAPARSLYVSAWFQKARDLIEIQGAPWLILSSFHGLVEPNAVIDTYDFTLNTEGVRARQAWARRVMVDLTPRLTSVKRVVMFAGQRYREFLVGPIRELGVSVEVPMENLTRGRQLAWLSDQ